jgi:glyoxylase-like metal-dependent hydrolase (beta-lactamase superfamily II)
VVVPPPAPVDTAAESRARAVALLERGIVALGGQEAVSRALAAKLEMESRTFVANPNQARDWRDTTPNPRPTRLRVLVEPARQRGVIESNSVSPGEIRFHLRTGHDTAGSYQLDLLQWRAGIDLARAPAPAGRAGVAGLVRNLPHLVVREALDAPSLRWIESRERDGARHEAVRYAAPLNGQVVELELDASTALPTRLTVPATRSALDFAEWRMIDGVGVPWVRVGRTAGRVTNEQRVSSVIFARALDDSLFAIPAGYADPPPAGPARATRLAEGVYRLDGMPGGYHAAFVVQPAGIAVLEAPTSPAFSDTALRVIGEVAPGLPVTHVLVTHHHNDHVGGLGPYVARGARLVVGAGLEEAVRRQLPDSLRARATFEPVGRSLTVGTGTRRVVAYPVANTHADGNVAYFVPAARVLFQGDLFYIPERGPVPPAFGVTEAMTAMVRTRGLRVEQVVGVHGRTGTWAEVRASIRRQPMPEAGPVR